MLHADKILKSKRISIFGYPATGKSTLAVALAKILNIKLYSLDKMKYKNNNRFEKRDIKDFEIEYNELFQNESWFIEGNSLDYIDRRFIESDLIIYFKSNKYISALKYTYRYIRINILKKEIRLGTNGNADKFDIGAIKWILNQYHKKIINLSELMQKYNHKIIIIKSYRQLKE